MSVGFDPTTYTIPEGDSGQLVIRKRGETVGPIEIFVSTSGARATGLYTLDVYYLIYITRLTVQLVMTTMR